MNRTDDAGAVVRKLQGLLQPARRRTLAAQLAALTALLTGLSALAVVLLVKLVQWLGPWWQQSR